MRSPRYTGPINTPVNCALLILSGGRRAGWLGHPTFTHRVAARD